MFQQMFTGIDGDGPFGGNGATKVWRSFLTEEYAKSFAKAGGIGIADQVYHIAARAPGGPFMSAPQTEAQPPIASVGEAERAIANLETIMERLAATIGEETARVRGGHLQQAGELEAAKTELARAYTVESTRAEKRQGLGRARSARVFWTRCAGAIWHSRNSCASI